MSIFVFFPLEASQTVFDLYPIPGADPSCLRARAGYSLDKSPARGRALSDGRGLHARCQPHIRSNLGFSILLKDTLTCSSAQLDLLYPLSHRRPNCIPMFPKKSFHSLYSNMFLKTFLNDHKIKQRMTKMSIDGN